MGLTKDVNLKQESPLRVLTLSGLHFTRESLRESQRQSPASQLAPCKVELNVHPIKTSNSDLQYSEFSKSFSDSP